MSGDGPATPGPSDAPGAAPDAVRDPDLPALDPEQAAALVARARSAFTDAGVATTYSGGVLSAEDGRRFGLVNLAARTAALDPGERDEVVADHVADLLADDPLPEGEDALRALVLQLWPVGALPDGPPAGAPEVLPGVVALAGLDLPRKVQQFLRDEDLEPYGGWDAVRTRARENLLAMPHPPHQALEAEEGDPASAVHVFISLAADPFGASRVLVLEELLRDAAGVAEAPHGILVAVPNQQLLVAHVLQGVQVLAATQLLVTVAEGESGEDRPGAISPEVFFLAPDGRREQVTRWDGERRTVAVNGAFADAFASLGLVDAG